MGKQKTQNILIGAAALASALLAFFGFLSVGANNSPAQITLLVLCSMLLLVLSGLYVYIIFLSVDREPNYFLFDRLAGHNLPLHSLSARVIDEKLTLYISENFGSERTLWTVGTLAADGKFGIGGAYRPLVAYKMLHDVANDITGENFRLFEKADISVITTLCRVIEKVGETDMARVILTYRTKGGSPENIMRYLTANAKYIQSRMLNYVRRHIELFY